MAREGFPIGGPQTDPRSSTSKGLLSGGTFESPEAHKGGELSSTRSCCGLGGDRALALSAIRVQCWLCDRRNKCWYQMVMGTFTLWTLGSLGVKVTRGPKSICLSIPGPRPPRFAPRRAAKVSQPRHGFSRPLFHLPAYLPRVLGPHRREAWCPQPLQTPRVLSSAKESWPRMFICRYL